MSQSQPQHAAALEPSEPPVSAQRARRLEFAIWVLVALALGTGVLRFDSLRDAVDVPLLVREHGAQWIFHDAPFGLKIYRRTNAIVAFRKKILIEATPSQALLTLHGFRDANLRLDDKLLVPSRRDASRWKTPEVVDLAPHLTPGEHELLIKVQHFDGPPALLVHCDALQLVSDASWESSVDARNWTAVRSADALRPTEQRERARTAPQALREVAPWLAAAAVAALALHGFCVWRTQRTGRPAIPPAAWIRWGLLGAWLLLIVHNLPRIPEGIGFDRAAHVDYVEAIWLEHRLPLATEGWQMFQSPFYYLCAAFWMSIAARLLDAAQLDPALRLLSMLCGLAQVEIVYRTLRSVLPGRQDLQGLGVLLGGLLPMNLYMSHYPGNEPLAGVLSAATFGLALSVLHGGDASRSPRRMLLIGALLGLAVLTKVTAVLLVAPLALWLIAVGWQRGEPIARIVRWLAAVFGTASLVAGWYYVRNAALLGTPFVGGWDVSRGIVWWQDPGYRTPQSLLSFGAALVHPTAIHPMGFWDVLYATFWCDGFLSSTVIFEAPPPWRLGFLMAGALLGLFPTALILAGAARVVYERRLAWRASAALALALVVIYLVAMLDLYLHVPIYSTVKASYTLGLLPAYALLFVTGADLLMRTGVGRALLTALVAAWAVAAYLAYFAIG